ncbi:MAG: putative acylesterase/phospholipase RssA [Bradymonadia bacterium]
MDRRAHFTQLQPLRLLERRLVRETLKKSTLSAGKLEVLRYALSVARLGDLRTVNGDVDLFDEVAPFRHWLLDQLVYFVDPDGLRPIDWAGVDRLIPAIVTKLRDARTHLLEHHVNQFSVDRFEREVIRKELVLVLGGGGGSGYSHLGAFAVIAELGLTPSMVVGSSMGAMLGLFRCQEKSYDPMATALALPRPTEFGRVFAPYRGFSKYGFPGSIELKARAIGAHIFHNLIGREIPTIDELAIPYRPVITGLRSGIGLALSDVEQRIARTAGRKNPVAVQSRIKLFRGVVRTMLANPRFLVEVVGGRGDLAKFNSIDAMGFSCAVPGIIHYDLFGDESDPSVRQMHDVFGDMGLFRVTDGGVVSNVPCRVAYDCVRDGELGSRNAFVLAFDAFAPVLNRNALFLPVQQWVRRTVQLDKPYSDHLITYKQPPSPVKLLASFETLQSVIAKVRSQMKPERPFIDAMMRPLPRWGLLENHLAP